VLRYIQNYRLSPEITKMAQPVKWILLSNFAQFHLIRVNESAPSFAFKLAELWPRREELWELLALENLQANRIDELYDQQHKAGLDQKFLTDLKRWRLLLANGFALRNQRRSLEDITLASQQLLDRFIFCRMLETRRLVEYNKLARTYSNYEVLYARADKNFSEVVRESLFIEIKNDFNTELFAQPLLCDQLEIDNAALAAVVGHEPLGPDLAATCGFESGLGELLAFRHLYSYDFSLMSQDVMGAVYERFLAHKLFQDGGRVAIEDTDELRKKEGIYYTPKYIVDYIVAHTLGEKIQPILAAAKTLLGYKNFKGAHAKIRELGQIKVLDPAMGSGSFLLVAFDTLVSAYAEYNAECRRIKKERNGAGSLFDADFALAEEVLNAPLHVLTENLFGVDLDKQAVEVAKLNLWLRYMAVDRDACLDRLRRKPRGGKPLNLLPNLTHNLLRGNSLIAAPAVAGDTAFDWQKEFPELMQRGGFDVVVGNPPYERIQTMQANAPQAVEFLKANYRAATSGNFDIYVCFIERGLQLLKANGAFGYICPHKFFQAQYGEPVRQLLSEGKHVRHILSFGDLQVFPQASTYTCLLFLNKEPQSVCGFVKVSDLDDWRATGTALAGQFPAEHFNANEWHLTLGETAPLFLKLSKQPVKFTEVTARVFQGPITSADHVFLFEEFRDAGRRGVTEVFSQANGVWVKLESTLLKRVVRAGSIGRYWAEVTALVLFPYDVKNHQAKLISALKLQKSFPLAWHYLQRHRMLLENREDGSFRDEAWYRFGRTQNLGLWEQPKLMVPYMITELGAYLDAEENLYFINVTTGGYGVTVDSKKVRLSYLCGLLNSRLLDFFLKRVSTNFRGGYFAANKQFLDKLPIKLVDPTKSSEVKLEKEIVERVEQVQAAHRQRVKLPEILARAVAHDANRTPCNLAHYLQRDFAAALKPEIVIDDVQRAGFVHAIQAEADGNQLTLTATVAAAEDAPPRPVPVLRLAFTDETLRQFVYARWKQFLDEHSRQKKWTKGKNAEPVYDLLVNRLAPLVYFQTAAGDNLRTIRELMNAVAAEAGASHGFGILDNGLIRPANQSCA
jgi:type I restriction-modification system DNA methylase subunit